MKSKARFCFSLEWLLLSALILSISFGTSHADVVKGKVYLQGNPTKTFDGIKVVLFGTGDYFDYSYSTTTSNGGQFSFTVATGLTGSLGVQDDCLSKIFYDVTAPTTHNLDVVVSSPFAITGTVKDIAGGDVSGFTIAFVGGSTTSTSSPTWSSPSPGHYTASVPCGWTGTIRAVKPGLYFEPWSTGKIIHTASHDFQEIDILQVTSPVGTPNWYVGLPATVSWSLSVGVSNVAQWVVQFDYVDSQSGCSYQPVHTETLSASARSVQWTVIDSPYQHDLCFPLIRATVTAKDANGAIVASCAEYAALSQLIGIISPSYGWPYHVSDPLEIGWYVAPGFTVSSQHLLESYDGGVTWDDLGSLSTGDRILDWTVPAFPYGNAKLKLVVTAAGFPGTGTVESVTDWIVGDTVARHGVISHNTIWSGAVQLDGDVRVDAGAKLTVNANTVIQIATTDAQNLNIFVNQVELLVLGELHVNGTDQAHVKFQSAAGTPTDHDWGLIELHGISSMDYAEVRHAEWGINIQSATSAVMNHCFFDNNKQADVRFFGSSSLAAVSNSTLTVGAGRGVEVGGSGVEVTQNIINGDGTSASGVYLSASTASATISGNTISGFSAGYGIHLDNGTSTITANTIDGCQRGIYADRGTHNIGTCADGGNEVRNCTVAGIYIECLKPGTCPSGCDVVKLRRNYVHNNQVGVYTRKTSQADLGTANDWGYNNFSGNTAYCIRNTSTTCAQIPARGNYLGGCDPLPNCFTGPVDLTDLLCSPPSGCSGGSLVFNEPTKQEPATERTGLLGIHPNPFNPTTTIAFQLKEQAWTTISVYSATGQLVRVESLGPQPAGQHAWVWRGTNQDGNTVSSGVYFIVLHAGTVTDKRKAVLLK